MNSSTWDERYAGTDLVWSTTPNQWVEQVADGLAPGRDLDLAGGEGRNALWLAARGWQATVVDFSQVALDRASAIIRASRSIAVTSAQRSASLLASRPSPQPTSSAAPQPGGTALRMTGW